MFFVRSAFWLTVMFLIIAPKDYDLAKDVASASQDALQAGQEAIVAQILSTECTSLECAGGKAALTVISGSKLSAAGTSPEVRPAGPVPLPRPRPERMS